MKYFLLIIIALCLIILIKGARKVARWWRAWKLEEQKKRPVTKYIPPKHIDERR